MYRIMKDGAFLSNEDKLRYTKHQSNGVDALCVADEADGLVINNEYIEPLASLTIEEFNGAAQLATMETALNELGVQTREVTM